MERQTIDECIKYLRHEGIKAYTETLSDGTGVSIEIPTVRIGPHKKYTLIVDLHPDQVQEFSYDWHEVQAEQQT